MADEKSLTGNDHGHNRNHIRVHQAVKVFIRTRRKVVMSTRVIFDQPQASRQEENEEDTANLPRCYPGRGGRLLLEWKTFLLKIMQ